MQFACKGTKNIGHTQVLKQKASPFIEINSEANVVQPDLSAIGYIAIGHDLTDRIVGDIIVHDID